MSMINVSNLSFYYDGSYEMVFEDVSFQIDTDWKLGFIGRNGRGKTTFLRLLSGQYEYQGKISASVEFDYFPYEVRDKTKQTIEVVEEIFPAYEFWELCREWSYLEGAEDVWFRPYETLSHGERTKILLAVLFLRQNRFLLIDEPTNHLDMETRQVVCNYLKRKSGFLLVSHDRTFLDGCIDHVLAINKKNIEVVQGNFSSWWENKRRQDIHEFAENERLKREIKNLSLSAKRAGGWADKAERTKIGNKSMKNGQKIAGRDYIGEKSKRMQQRKKNLGRRRGDALEEKSVLLKNVETQEELKIIPAVHHKEVLIEAKKLSLSYGTHSVCEGIDFQICTGDCLVLAGKNGCGKSSVIHAVLNADKKQKLRGELTAASGLIISYVPQDTSFLNGKLKDYIKQEHINETLFKQFLRKLDFSREHFEKNMEEYSAGQRKKVLLAKSLSEQAHVYIWDEPLNYIDIFSRIQLEELILKYRPTLMLVEHDKSFVERVGTKVLTL